MTRAKKGRGDRRNSTVFLYFLQGDGAGDTECHKHHLLVWIYLHSRTLCATPTNCQGSAIVLQAWLCSQLWGRQTWSNAHSCHHHLATQTQCSRIHHGGSIVSLNSHTLFHSFHLLLTAVLPTAQNSITCSFHGWRSCKICTGLYYYCQHYYITLGISFTSLQKNSMPLPKVCSNMSLPLSLKSNELVKLTHKSSMRLSWDLLSL